MKQGSWDAAKLAFSIESEAILNTLKVLDKHEFGKAVDCLAEADRIACCGCGHSGIACAHFAHLLCCIDRPARFLSPSEAVHGGAGFLQKNDVLVVASRGGKTEELLPIEQIARVKGVKIIAITENIKSSLAAGADIVLAMKVTRECDKYNCQGTTSFVVLSAIFDALQTSLIEETNYNNEKFLVVHPGGAVGKRLKQSSDEHAVRMDLNG
jgi:D-arabinose 5-phosphate isomerase GutQ